MPSVASPIPILASGEGTSHITGTGNNIYFMDDKMFGTIYGHPLWAIYHCGSEIEGQIDIQGTYHHFDFNMNRFSIA
jgi:hypothetical protein